MRSSSDFVHHGRSVPDEAAALSQALSAAGSALLAPSCAKTSRRELLVSSLIAALTLALGDGCRKAPTGADRTPVGATTRAAGSPNPEVEVTLLVNGRRVNACLTLAIRVEGAQITTIEGLSLSSRPAKS